MTKRDAAKSVEKSTKKKPKKKKPPKDEDKALARIIILSKGLEEDCAASIGGDILAARRSRARLTEMANLCKVARSYLLKLMNGEVNG